MSACGCLHEKQPERRQIPEAEIPGKTLGNAVGLIIAYYERVGCRRGKIQRMRMSSTFTQETSQNERASSLTKLC